MANFLKYFLAFLLTSVLFVAVFEEQSTASIIAGARDRGPVRLHGGQSVRETGILDRGKIIEVLESRLKRGHLPEKAVQKLDAMNDEEIRLVASLCDRISHAGDKAGADVAFLLVTALIVLS
jgi:hypothetical protein